jgi:hypothetical protein
VFARLDAAVLAAAVSLLAADRIPTFDVETHCRDIAKRAAPLADADICLRKERAARDRLARQWAGFAAADKAHCLELSRMAEPTYTELLTCLELAREVRNLRERERSTTGRAPQ